MRAAHARRLCAEKESITSDPLEVALAFEDAGLRRLHLVDLDGAKAGAVSNWKVLETIAGKTKLVVDFGGGIKDGGGCGDCLQFRGGAGHCGEYCREGWTVVCQLACSNMERSGFCWGPM